MAMTATSAQPRPVGSASTIPSADVVSLGSRDTPELVFALVGPIGSGVSTVSNLIASRMRDVFGYKSVSVIKISEIIKEDASKTDTTASWTDAVSRSANLQEIGNSLRDKFGPDYLANRAVEKINDGRTDGGSVSSKTHASPRRHVTIIDALKHPDELKLLSRVYGDLFYTFCVFAPESVRLKRLQKNGIKRSNIDSVFEMDESATADFGQKVRDTSHLADFFIRNDLDNVETVGKTVDRYLEIIFGTQIHTPTLDETAMYGAIVAARGSACLSRQVGAVIYNKNGELIGQGCNDVPKGGGGLYRAEDADLDHRCYKWKGKVCHNDAGKDERYEEIVRALDTRGLLVEGAYSEARKVIASTRLKDLIEFSRAVHAEMEAIISVARNANEGLVGATLYSTVFPCHSCARHIVASGISRVVYIEPYAKSLATTLHDDSLSDAATNDGRVVYQPYQGVAPRNIDRFFGVRGARKRLGKVVETVSREALPVGLAPLDGIAIRETLVINEAAAKELGQGAGNDEQAEAGQFPAGT